jgi:hypothetical protein
MTNLAARLLTFLEERAGTLGLAMARNAPIQEQLHCSRAELDGALRELESAGKGRVLSALPFLAFRLTAWPNHRENMAKAGPVPYSYKSSLSQSPLNRNSYSHRDASEEAALLQEILTTLGESDPTTFRGAIEAYSPEVIREALHRVRSMHRIRKTPTAAFRFLLPRIAKNFKSAS